MAAAPRAKSDTAARARRDRRRQRMMPGNGADRSVGRGWVTQYPSASKRPPRAKVQPHPPDANVTVLFPPHDGARPRAADLLAKSPDWLKAAPMRENLRTSWRQSEQKQDHCPSLLNHNAKYKRLLPPCCDFANGVPWIMLLVPGCPEPETASTFLNQQPDPSSCVNPGVRPASLPCGASPLRSAMSCERPRSGSRGSTR